MKIVNIKNQLMLFLSSFLVSILIGFFLFYETEQIIAKTAHSFIRNTPALPDISNVTQQFFKIICESGRYDVCYVVAKANSGQVLATVPTRAFLSSSSFQLSIKIIQDQFFPPAVVEINLRPSLTYAITWLLAGLSITLFVSIIFFLFRRRQRMKELSKRVDLIKDALLTLTRNAEPNAFLRSEVPEIADRWLEMKAELLRLQEETASAAKFKAIADTTKLLAHDVRKPFSQLKIILETLEVVCQIFLMEMFDLVHRIWW